MKQQSACRNYIPQQRRHDGSRTKDGEYLGKCLGNHITDEQMEQIRAGTFEGMDIGDYWILGGIKFSIFDFGSSIWESWRKEMEEEDERMKHHIVLCPHDDLKQEG